MALKYESYLQGLGIQFPPRATQEAYATASTDQGDVSYEVPQIHPVYKINTPEGVGNHTPGFAEVPPPPSGPQTPFPFRRIFILFSMRVWWDCLVWCW
jgi:hypothetical protein